MSVYMLRAQIRELLDTKILPLIAKGDFSVKSVCAFLEEANKTTAGKDFAEEIVEAVKDKGYTVRYSAPHYYIYR